MTSTYANSRQPEYDDFGHAKSAPKLEDRSLPDYVAHRLGREAGVGIASELACSVLWTFLPTSTYLPLQALGILRVRDIGKETLILALGSWWLVGAEVTLVQHPRAFSARKSRIPVWAAEASDFCTHPPELFLDGCKGMKVLNGW